MHPGYSPWTTDRAARRTNVDGDSAAPRRVSAPADHAARTPASHRLSHRGDLTLTAELPRREAIPPLRGDRDATGRAMTEASERRAGTTRQRLIAAAACQFADRPYSMVSLDDTLAEAELTKGAMYFHFPSKQALAVAIIDDLTEMSRATVIELLARKMSGLETPIDLVYLLAVQDTQYEVARAGVRLLETLDNTTAPPTAVWQSWIEFITTLIQRAVADGDVVRIVGARRPAWRRRCPVEVASWSAVCCPLRIRALDALSRSLRL
jgi:AcrR family transcriptional regulator